MEFRIQATGELKTQGEVRRIHSNTSLPRVWDANVCAFLGVDPVLAAPRPEPSASYKQVGRNGAVQDANGNWVQAYIETAMFADTTEDGVTTTKAEHEAAYQAQLDADAKQLRIKEAELVFAEEVKNITAGYTDEEIKTWDKQIGEAAVYTADATAFTPLLDALTAATGESKEDLVERIQAKSNAYAAAIGASLGKKQKAIIDLGAA